MADNIPGGEPTNQAQLPTGQASANTNTAQGQMSTASSTPAFRSSTTDNAISAQAPAQQSNQEAARIAELERQLADSAKEAARARQLEEKLNTIENEKLAEQGKYKELYEKEVDQRKKDLQSARRELARETLRNMAISEGIIDADIVDMIPARSFQYDEDTGRFTNVRDLLAQHKADKPHLYRDAAATQASSTAVNLARPTTGHPGNAPEQVPPGKKDISGMSRQEYEVEKRNYIRSLRGK
jgi:hypothetical protein